MSDEVVHDIHATNVPFLQKRNTMCRKTITCQLVTDYLSRHRPESKAAHTLAYLIWPVSADLI